MIAKGNKFYMGLYSEIVEIFLVLNIRTVATNFSLFVGSYILNKFPSIVMFGMKGFHVSASGAIQGHHGLLVTYRSSENTVGKVEIARIKQFLLFSQCFLPVWRTFCPFHQI